MRLIFDVEANGLLAEATKVHCIAAIDIDTKLRYVWGPDEIPSAIEVLSRASSLVAHNGIRYDFPLLHKLYGVSFPNVLDTMTLARLIKSNTKERDLAERRMPGKLIGSHSLQAWGLRLGCEKGAFEGPWADWSQAMQDYCVQDVEVNLRLWEHLEPEKYSQVAIDLEHRIALVTNRMEGSGWPFSVESAGHLHARLVEEQANLQVKLKEQFGSWYESAGEFTPKVNNAKQGYSKGIPVTKVKQVDFNPASRQHIYKRLMALGWKPSIYTDSGQPQVDEAVLDQIAKDFPQADLLSRWLMLNKRVGQLATGDNAWLKLVDKDGIIHPAYNTNGCVTGRASHITPNIAQVPRVGKAFGAECRALFVVPNGWRMLGADQSGLEQRCLAHYTYPYDKGTYAETSLNTEDIHWLHATAIGIANGDETGDLRKILRDATKTWFYAYVYGARDNKLSSILTDLNNDLRKLGIPYSGVTSGEQSRRNFGERIPALEGLRTRAVATAEKTKALKALDGRIIPCNTAPYKALNYLCQSAGAIICKEWVASTYEALIKEGFEYGFGGDFTFLGWIHDELQVAVRKGPNIDRARTIIRDCGRGSGKPYEFRVPLEVEVKEGKTWAGTH